MIFRKKAQSAQWHAQLPDSIMISCLGSPIAESCSAETRNVSKDDSWRRCRFRRKFSWFIKLPRNWRYQRLRRILWSHKYRTKFCGLISIQRICCIDSPVLTLRQVALLSISINFPLPALAHVPKQGSYTRNFLTASWYLVQSLALQEVCLAETRKVVKNDSWRRCRFREK